MILFESLFAFMLGLVLGSFSSALAYRIPKEIDWVSKRSACTICNKSLGISDLIPVLSWLLSKGKCRQCGEKVSAQYPLMELGCGILCAIASARFGLGPEFIFIALAVPILMALLVIDIHHFILPNILVIALAILGVIRLIYFSAFEFLPYSNNLLLTHGLGAFVYAGLTWGLAWFLTKVLKKEALGFGDVKFFFAAGLWLGMPLLPVFLILSGAAGVISAFLWRVLKKQDIFPFGPALIASLYIVLIFQGLF